MEVAYRPIADLTESEREELAALSRAVYPPEVAAAWPGRHLEWAAPVGGVFVRVAGAGLVSYAGVVVRHARHDDRPVLVGGVGGVKTHPAARRQGCAARAVGRAVEVLREEAGVAFALLVCDAQLMGYYGGLGWETFGERLLVSQRGGPDEFVFNRVMVCSAREAAPTGGTIDLLGPPW